MIRVLTEFKISGDLRELIDKLPLESKSIENALSFLCCKFEDLAKKVLAFELSSYSSFTKVAASSSQSDDALAELLTTYRHMSRLSSPGLVVSVVLTTLAYFAGREFRKLGVAVSTILLHHMPTKDFLRYLTGELFLAAAFPNGSRSEALHGLKWLWDLFMV
jgi:hypothetical protein